MKKLVYLLAFAAFNIPSASAQNALQFDGVNDFVQSDFPGVLGSNNRTFEAWVNLSPSAPSSNLTILDYGLNAVGSRNTFLISASRSLVFISGGTNANLPGSSMPIQAGQWTHVAFVLDNGTGYTYINGVQASTGNLSTVNTPSGNANLTIGQRVTGGNIPFAGSIDEVRIWDVARTHAEIMADMNAELCSYPASLLAYFKMNQGQAAGNNSGLTNVIDEIGSTSTANNFSMTGSGSNWVNGSGIAPVTPLNLGISLDSLNSSLTADDTSLNVKYQWFNCTANGILAGDTNRTYITRAAGTYAVILDDGNCIDTSACISVNFSAPVLPGEALDFDGVDDLVQTTFPGILGSADRTFEAWVKVSASAPSANLTVLDYGTNAAGSRNTFLVDANRNVRFVSGGTNGNLPATTKAIQAGAWTHVAFVLDGGTGYVYVDGVQSSTGNLSNVNTPAGNADLSIGERVSGGSIPFAGAIDEVRIWNVARSANEIFTDMNTKYCGPVPGLVAYYSMDGGIAGGNNSSIVSVANAIGSGDGVLNNFALTGGNSNFVNPGAMLSPSVIDLSISQNGAVLTANDTTVDGYQWYDCNAQMILVGDTARSFQSPANGDYAVILSKDACLDTSACINVVGVGLEQLQFKDQFSLSQNPVEEDFYLSNPFHFLVQSELRSIDGRLIARKTWTSSKRLNFVLGGEPAGIYLLRVVNKVGNTAFFKVVKH